MEGSTLGTPDQRGRLSQRIAEEEMRDASAFAVDGNLALANTDEDGGRRERISVIREIWIGIQALDVARRKRRKKAEREENARIIKSQIQEFAVTREELEFVLWRTDEEAMTDPWPTEIREEVRAVFGELVTAPPLPNPVVKEGMWDFGIADDDRGIACVAGMSDNPEAEIMGMHTTHLTRPRGESGQFIAEQ